MKLSARILFALLLVTVSPPPAHSQWWEKGKGYQNDYIYTKAYCYGRGNGLNHEQALIAAYNKDRLPEQTEKEKSLRIKKLASIILDFISGTGNNDEFTGCRRAHFAELGSSI